MTIGEGIDFDSEFEKVELAPLGISKIIEKLCKYGKLFVRGGKYGILAEINLVFIEFETLTCMQ